MDWRKHVQGPFTVKLKSLVNLKFQWSWDSVRPDRQVTGSFILRPESCCIWTGMRVWMREISGGRNGYTEKEVERENVPESGHSKISSSCHWKMSLLRRGGVWERQAMSEAIIACLTRSLALPWMTEFKALRFPSGTLVCISGMNRFREVIVVTYPFSWQNEFTFWWNRSIFGNCCLNWQRIVEACWLLQLQACARPGIPIP